MPDPEQRCHRIQFALLTNLVSNFQIASLSKCIDIGRTCYHSYLLSFDFNAEKNELLLNSRGVNFHDVIEAVAEKGILLDFDHPDQVKYAGQRIIVVDIDGYAYCVPYVVEGETWFLKTVYPSRKFKYLIEGDSDETL